MSDEGVKVKPGVAAWNSNTPFPKLLAIKCPATKCGVSCAGRDCRSDRKACFYRLFLADPVAGRAAINALKRDGYAVL